MTLLESQRRARARRALRNYQRAANGPKDDPGFPPPGIVRRLVRRWLRRMDRGDGGMAL